MATPSPQSIPAPKASLDGPRTVLGAKKVDLALIKYRDEFNTEQVQLAVVGDNTVHLLESRHLGLSKNTTPQGIASEWLRDGILKALSSKE